MIKTLVNIGVGLATFAGVVGLQMQRQTLLTTQPDQNLPLWQQQAALIQTQLLLWREMPGFGFDNMVANFWLIQFNIYFGDDEARDALGYGLIPDFFQVILGQDPRFIRAYLLLSTTGTLYAGQPEQSIQIASRAMERLSPQVPGSYFPWLYRGTDEMLFLGDGKAALVSFQTAADWAQKWNTPESEAVVQRATDLVASLKENPDSRVAKVIGWLSILSYATTPQVQAIATQKILDAGGRVAQLPDGRRVIILPRDVQKRLRS
ncbi:hypothetical protein GlitD10_0358 [Gloeomargarita lithophora Alchichica-D10]|uniref:Uncharacterized protein n=1 Tax=Gloeomargarita lithophora Alchichica-D10 TaxID=1188229 RepID=A0A1J0A9P8_9CYAN|nr:hypothetical protein [Gloeomargarita lithophora]APB32668.1 hypothetical protein GlitD10_0358 [Gloeomargarita lithophora Alchichica-D10]